MEEETKDIQHTAETTPQSSHSGSASRRSRAARAKAIKNRGDVETIDGQEDVTMFKPRAKGKLSILYKLVNF